MKPAKRKKWEPAALMILVLALGMWIAFGPASKPHFATHPGSLTQTIRIGNDRGTLEAFKASPADTEYCFRMWMKDIPGTPETLTRSQAERLIGARAVKNTIDTSRNWLFRTLNITSWTSVVWVGIGLLGQLAFSGRMVLQWIVSEKKRQSIITESFWWFSLFGGVTLFSYFIWRQDPIGILGQASGIVVYARNLRLIHKHKRRAARDRAAALAAAHHHGSAPHAHDAKPAQPADQPPEPVSIG
jgi:lipid-A-disaccharide synthase-like uncharacterized protein